MITRRTLLSAALLTPAAVLAKESARVDLRKVRRIVTLGDSITQGGGRPGGYVWQMDQYLQLLYPQRKIEIVNAGISGHKSNDMLARFQRDVLDKKPDVVTISVGINDVWHGFTAAHPAGYGPNRIPLPAYRKNVAALLEAAKKAGVKVVLFTTTIFEDKPDSPRNLRVAGYNDVLRELAHEYGAVVADQYAAFMEAWRIRPTDGPKLTTDEVHLALPGDTLMARTALRAMGVSERDLDRVEAQVAARVPK